MAINFNSRGRGMVDNPFSKIFEAEERLAPPSFEYIPPEVIEAIDLRKEANDATNKATDQYEADVADFKNTLAIEKEQGIASLPQAPVMRPPQAPPSMAIGRPVETPEEEFRFNPPTPPTIAPPSEPIFTPPPVFREEPIYTPPSEPIFTPPPPPVREEPIYTPPPVFNDERPPMDVPSPIDRVGPGGGSPGFYDPPPVFIDDREPVFTPPPVFEEEPVFTPPPPVFTPPPVFDDNGGFEPPLAPPKDDIINPPSPPENPYDGVFPPFPPRYGITPPGDIYLPPDEGGPGDEDGFRPPYDPPYDPPEDPPEDPPYVPPPPPPPPPPPSGPVNYYTGKELSRPYVAYSTESGAAPLRRNINLNDFGRAPGFQPPPPPELVRGPIPPKRPPRIQPQGMSMGGNINKGISMLPMNGQGDTLTTQVFQSGFRPRR